MSQEISNLVEEINQIERQYRQEVPGKRRAWPESIKVRVNKLCELGISAKKISNLTQISYFNILAWISRNPHYHPRKRKTQGSGHFIPIPMQTSERKSSTVTVHKKIIASSTIATVTVTLPNGIRVEGVTLEFLSSWLGR